MVFASESSIPTMAEAHGQIARDHMLKAVTMSAWRATQRNGKSNRIFLRTGPRHKPAIHALDRPVEMNPWRYRGALSAFQIFHRSSWGVALFDQATWFAM